MLGRITAGTIAGLAAATMPQLAMAQGLAIRFYPDRILHSYELAGERGLHGAARTLSRSRSKPGLPWT